VDIPVLVQEDSILQGLRGEKYLTQLLFMPRPARSAAVVPQMLLLAQRPPLPFTLHEYKYAGSIPVLESFSQYGGTQSFNPLAFLAPRVGPPYPDPESYPQPYNHGLLFQVQRHARPQIMGAVFEIPDLTADPWLEYWRPQKAVDLTPYRSLVAKVIGQPFSLLTYRSAQLWQDVEQDTFDRRAQPGLALIFGRPFTTGGGGGTWSCGVLDIYDAGAGALVIEWGPFVGYTPNSFNIYVNGVLRMNVAGPPATITGLQEASYNPATQIITPAGVYTINVVAVVNGVEVATSVYKQVTMSPPTVMLVTPMKRLWPFPNSGLD